MKKYIFTVFLSIFILTLNVYANDEVDESGIFQYAIDENGVRITNCTDFTSEIIEIPTEINGISVYSVGGFIGNYRNTKKVIIPEGVTEIDEMAFYWNNVIESVNLPETLTKIGRSAFYSCESLTEVHIPKNVNEIGDEGSFRECTKLPQITVDEENKWFSSVDGVLYNKEKTSLILYPAGKQDESFIVPEGVTKVNNSAFYNCDYLEELIFADSVEIIGEGAVFYCDNITSIHIPKNVNNIQQVPFGACDSLSEITVSKDNKFFTAEDGLLYNYNKSEVVFCIPNITEPINLPNSVIKICDGAFKYSNATEVIIPEGTEYIGKMAFYNSDLEVIHIPSTILKIDKDAFDDCYSFSQIYYSGTEEQWWDLITDKGDIMELNSSCQIDDDGTYAEINIRIPKIYSIPNNKEIFMEYTLLFCQYGKDNRLVSCETEKSLQNKIFSINSETETVKVFVWENLSNIKPLLPYQEVYIQ